MSVALHQFGRMILARVWQGVTGEAPSLAELQIAGATATLETSYGKGWKGTDANGFTRINSHNWGAINCHNKAMGCFQAVDSSPGKAPESRGFQVYPDDDAGAADLVRNLTHIRPRSWAAMKQGDIDEFSRAMRGITGDPVYYEGTNPDKEKAAQTHAGVVELHVNAIAQAMGEEVAAHRGGATGGGGDDDSSTPLSSGQPSDSATSFGGNSSHDAEDEETPPCRD